MLVLRRKLPASLLQPQMCCVTTPQALVHCLVEVIFLQRVASHFCDILSTNISCPFWNEMLCTVGLLGFVSLPTPPAAFSWIFCAPLGMNDWHKLRHWFPISGVHMCIQTRCYERGLEVMSAKKLNGEFCLMAVSIKRRRHAYDNWSSAFRYLGVSVYADTSAHHRSVRSSLLCAKVAQQVFAYTSVNRDATYLSLRALTSKSNQSALLSFAVFFGQP